MGNITGFIVGVGVGIFGTAQALVFAMPVIVGDILDKIPLPMGTGYIKELIAEEVTKYAQVDIFDVLGYIIEGLAQVVG